MQPARNLMTELNRQSTAPQPAVALPRCSHYELRLGNDVITPRLQCADRMWSRMRGLLGRASIAQDEGLWITPCNSIHMFFMRFAIDVVFIDADFQIVRVFEDLKPWRMARGGKHARTVLELPPGKTAFYNLRVGDRLTLSPAEPR